MDGEGNLKIPPEIAAGLGIGPGSRAKVDVIDDRLVVHRPVSHIARVYLEPTTRCNLRCETCMRNAWVEPVGDMDGGTFGRVLESPNALGRSRAQAAGQPPVTLFFGGLDEPLVHPGIIGMVRAAKETGVHVELVTNGILPDEGRSRDFIDAGLDALWVSLDGASPECYGGVGTGGSLSRVMDNLKDLKDLKILKGTENPLIDVAFVGMKKTSSSSLK